MMEVYETRRRWMCRRFRIGGRVTAQLETGKAGEAWEAECEMPGLILTLFGTSVAISPRKLRLR